MNLYFRNTGTSWADPNNWSLTDGGASAGVIPTSADDVFFTALSGLQVFQDVGNFQQIKSLTCTGYTGTITMDSVAAALSNSISVLGNITLGSGMKLVNRLIAPLSQLTMNGVGTLITNGVIIPHFSTVNNAVVTLIDTLNASFRITFPATGGNVTLTGSFGFITAELANNDTAGSTMTLQAGINYLVKGKLTSVSNSGGARGKFVSSTPGTMAKLTVMGDEVVAYTDFTDIDASGGRPIYSFGGAVVITNCININPMTDIVAPPNRTVVSSSIL